MTRPQSYLEPLNVRGRIARAQPLGLPILNLGFNELPYPPSPGVAQALAERAQKLGSYGSPGCDLLRAKLGEVHGLDPEHIICGNGSEELIDVIARNFLRPGDEMLISQFGYIQFEMTAHRIGATLKKAPEVDYTTDPQALLAATGPHTKIVFLANPNNPTGTMLPAEDVVQLASDMPENVVLVLDLAYGEFAGEAYCQAMHRIVERQNNVIVLRTFSKAFGMAGVRVGWAHAPDWMLPGFYAARGMGSVNGMAQAAGGAALGEMDVIQARVAEIVSERDRVAGVLRQMGMTVVPSQSNFLLVKLVEATPDDTEALVEHLFDTCGIIVNRTREAGLEPFMRFSLSLPDHNDLLLTGIRAFLDAR
ncbi:pyridoxal phosphate-dependent aminotransferase [Phaeobacter marinintestinus]|uniref:pyridoxal phosphate-dependent aminotransferase n=1 Tax=Falsiphaeobacter marinintestinus TaxID=1492905 RepID=UPI001648E12E|nr:histidinol-phosphate transaminase [Phaeobacter marinintestinus]